MKYWIFEATDMLIRIHEELRQLKSSKHGNYGGFKDTKNIFMGKSFIVLGL